MDPCLIAKLREVLPADLIYSLAFAGIINRSTFLSITFEDDCGDKIRMADIISYIRSTLPDFMPPAELRRYLPICAHTHALSDSSIVHNIQNWSLSPGYKHMIVSLQQDLQSSRPVLEDCEPSSKRRRISESMVFDITAQDVSMLEVAPEFTKLTSTPVEIEKTLQAPTPYGEMPQATIEVRGMSQTSVAAGETPQISVAAGETPQISVAAGETPQISVAAGETPQTSVAAGETPQISTAAKTGIPPSPGRRRRRGKRSRKRKRVETPEQGIRAPVIVQTIPPSSGVSERNQNGCAVGNHVIFDSDGDVEESREVEVQAKTFEVAQKRKVAKQKPNFSTPSVKRETPKPDSRRVSFPEMSKSTQLSSRQWNSSYFFKQQDPETSSAPSIPASQLKKRKRVQKVDIDSTSSSSSSSSSSSDSEDEKPVKVPLQQDEDGGKASSDTGPPVAPRNYDVFPAVSKPPDLGSLICFRVLELNTLSLTPDISDYKEGILRSYDPHRDRCVIEVVANKRKCEGGGKFDVYIETEDGILTNYEEEESTLITAWSALQDPRLIQSSTDKT